MSAKQAYVLGNLDRVESLSLDSTVLSSMPRYRLDGQDCSYQIKGLLVRNQIVRRPDGQLQRMESAAALPSP